MDMLVASGGINFPYADKPWSLISIYTEPKEEFLTEKNKLILKGIGMKESLSLCFWDIENKREIFEKHPDARLFNKEQAKLIIGMLPYADQYDDAVLIVHCDAGISRSGAVGTFAVDFLGLDYEVFTKENPCLMPNFHVYNLLRRVAMQNDGV